MALASPAAFAALRVVTTVKNPSFANFCAIAPPTPQRTPTGSSLSSTGLPCASNVLRPSACHFEVAPITTATGFPLVFLPPISLISLGLLVCRLIFPRWPAGRSRPLQFDLFERRRPGERIDFHQRRVRDTRPDPACPEIIVDRRKAHALVQNFLDLRQHHAAFLGVGL